MSIVKKAVSAAGPLMRVLIGAGAVVLLILGLKEKPGKDAGRSDIGGGHHPWRRRQRKRS